MFDTKKSAKAVIDANWGDSGKGRLVDYLCAVSEKDTLVVRFSGGANAGHTVITGPHEQIPNVRHVFGHIASGALAGKRSFLSEDFIVNPFLFAIEHAQLVKACGGILPPTIYIDPNARVTTPYEIHLNRIVETRRGAFRHGSCGVGIFETVKRHEIVPLTYDDLWKDAWKGKFLEIAKHHAREQLTRETATSIALDYEQTLAIFEREVAYLLEHTKIAKLSHLSFEEILFEGSQGLALDQNRVQDMPHLTPANTGLRNVVKECSLLGVTDIHTHYVSRTYFTRHGAGPLPGECPMLDLLPPRAGFNETNVSNAYQEQFRYAPFNPASFLLRVCEDQEGAIKMNPEIKHTRDYNFTHADIIALRLKSLDIGYTFSSPVRDTTYKTGADMV